MSSISPTSSSTGSAIQPAAQSSSGSGSANSSAAQQFLFESEVSQIYSTVKNFQSQLPGDVSGSALISNLLSQAMQGPPDPTDPGAHVLDPQS